MVFEGWAVIHVNNKPAKWMWQRHGGRFSQQMAWFKSRVWFVLRWKCGPCDGEHFWLKGQRKVKEDQNLGIVLVRLREELGKGCSWQQRFDVPMLTGGTSPSISLNTASFHIDRWNRWIDHHCLRGNIGAYIHGVNVPSQPGTLPEVVSCTTEASLFYTVPHSDRAPSGLH